MVNAVKSGMLRADSQEHFMSLSVSVWFQGLVQQTVDVIFLNIIRVLVDGGVESRKCEM